MTEAPNEARNLDLAEALADITEYITSRLTALREVTGINADFHLIVLDGDMMEASGSIADFELMSNAMAETVAGWVASGHIEVNDEDDGEPLFSATFDPQKARLS